VLSETHFGLGEHRATRITVHWPSGEDSVIDDVPEHAQILIREPQ
jgi:hypothetical protein